MLRIIFEFDKEVEFVAESNTNNILIFQRVLSIELVLSFANIYDRIVNTHTNTQLDTLGGNLRVFNHLGIKTDFDLVNHASIWKYMSKIVASRMYMFFVTYRKQEIC